MHISFPLDGQRNGKKSASKVDYLFATEYSKLHVAARFILAQLWGVSVLTTETHQVPSGHKGHYPKETCVSSETLRGLEEKNTKKYFLWGLYMNTDWTRKRSITSVKHVRTTQLASPFFLLYSAITVTNGFLQKPEMRCLKSLIILDGFNKFHSFPYIYKLNFLSVRFLQTNAGTVTHSANATWTRKENLKREK